MNRIVRICFFMCGIYCLSHAWETAITASGKKVILRADGTWEWFDPNRHLDVQDVRVQQPIEIVLKYKDYNFCLKEKRMWLEAEGYAAAAVADSLKRVPKGGRVYVQMPTRMVNKASPRVFQYVIKDSKGRVMAQQTLSEDQAVPSDDLGLSDMAVIDIPTVFKGELTVEIRDRATGALYEYRIPESGGE